MYLLNATNRTQWGFFDTVVQSDLFLMLSFYPPGKVFVYKIILTKPRFVYND